MADKKAPNRITALTGLTFNYTRLKKKIKEYYKDYRIVTHTPSTKKKKSKKSSDDESSDSESDSESNDKKKSKSKEESDNESDSESASDDSGSDSSGKKKKKKINPYNPRFQGSASLVFVTSMMEQLVKDLFSKAAKQLGNEDKNINRKILKNTIKGDIDILDLFRNDLERFDTKDNYDGCNFIKKNDIAALMDKIKLPDDVQISEECIILVRYLIDKITNRCVQIIPLIKECSNTKSIKFIDGKNAIRIVYGEHLFKRYRVESDKIIEKVEAANKKNKKSKKKANKRVKE